MLDDEHHDSTRAASVLRVALSIAGSLCRVLGIASQIIVLQLGQKLAHILLDFVPALDERFHRWVIARIETRSPLGRHND